MARDALRIVMSLSVILITKNEAANVDACLASVAFAASMSIILTSSPLQPTLNTATSVRTDEPRKNGFALLKGLPHILNQPTMNPA